MGSFSWLKADELTKTANVVYGKPFKFLIPQKFGGGFIEDHYQDYGYLGKKEDGSPKYDMYELLAFWNADMQDRYYANRHNGGEPNARLKSGSILDRLKWDGDFPLMKEIDENTRHNRGVGIDIGCYDNEINLLEYPLKLVSASYKGTYEECDGRSYSDPNQGFYPLSREEARKIMERRLEYETDSE